MNEQLEIFWNITTKKYLLSGWGNVEGVVRNFNALYLYLRQNPFIQLWSAGIIKQERSCSTEIECKESLLRESRIKGLSTLLCRYLKLEKMGGFDTGGCKSFIQQSALMSVNCPPRSGCQGRRENRIMSSSGNELNLLWTEPEQRPMSWQKCRSRQLPWCISVSLGQVDLSSKMLWCNWLPHS